MAYLRGRTVKNSLLKNLSSITIAVFKSLVGQSRRFSDVGMSALPPTPDLCLRRSQLTLWAKRRHPAMFDWSAPLEPDRVRRQF